MALTQLAPPYPIFTDKNGDPLDNGYLYFGEVNKNPETNPIQVYYDSAFTQPAAQPLRTSNGYVMRNGSPALIYADSQFSVTVRDKNNALVIYSPVGYGVDPSSVTGNVRIDDFIGDGSETVFTLSASASTKRAVNIYIDGVHQENSSYEVSGTTLTFSEAPPLNSAIEVVTFENSIVAAGNAANIDYDQGSSGYVQRTVESRLRDIVFAKDFGAVGDGIADDTTAITNAMNAASGKVLDGANQTYKVTSAISVTSENITIQNMTIDTSSTLGALDVITFAGTLGTSTSLSANAAAGDSVITVVSTSGFVADGYAYIKSNAVFSTSGTVLLGQVVKIKSVDSATQVTVYDDVLYAFNTSDGANLSPLNTKKNITFRNVKFIGADDVSNSQTAIRFTNCSNVTVDNCSFDYYSYTSVTLDRCVNSKIVNTSTRFARRTGLSYGFAINNGSYSISIDNCYGEDTRHMVTVGDNDGVNLFVRVSNCHAASQKDAGIDAHAACDFMVIDGNTIECVQDAPDGIIFQGLTCNITDNIVVGGVSQGIRVQNWANNVGTGSAIITGNSISNIGTTSTDVGINIDYGAASGSILTSCVISNNTIDGTFEYGLYVYNNSAPYDLNNLSIHNNIFRNSASTSGIFIRTASGAAINNCTISGNIVNASGSTGIYLLGGGANEITKSVISGNVLQGTTFGIRLTNVQDCVVSGNLNNSTQRVEVATSTGVVLDQSQSVPKTMTNSTYVVAEDDLDLIANRAGTITVTLPTASEWAGRLLNIKTVQAQAVDSASANVVLIGDTGAGTTILPATDGAWAQLRSSGTEWIIMQKG